MTETTRSRRGRPVWIAALVGVLHLAVLPFYVASGLLAPGWAVLGLLVLWMAGAAAIVTFRDRGPVLLLVPVGAVALWFAVLTAGERLLGWVG